MLSAARNIIFEVHWADVSVCLALLCDARQNVQDVLMSFGFSWLGISKKCELGEVTVAMVSGARTVVVDDVECSPVM